MRYQLFLFLLLPLTGFTQMVKTLPECLQAYSANDLRRERLPLIDQNSRLQAGIVRSEKMPSLIAKAFAQIQSEVADFPFELPPPIGDPLDLPLYRAQVQAEASYLLYDGGMSRSRLEAESASRQVALTSLEADIARGKEQVLQTYFAILLLDQKNQILENSRQAVAIRLDRLRPLVAQGMALPADTLQLQLEWLKLGAQLTESAFERQSYLDLLTDLTGFDAFSLQIPSFETFSPPVDPTARLEFPAFQAQQDLLLAQDKLLSANRLPKLALFGQAGLGYPNPLNLFDANLSPYALGGFQASWPITDWGKTRREAEKLEVQSRLIQNQAEVFTENIQRQAIGIEAQIRQNEALLENDQTLLEIQEAITRTTTAQLEAGLATASDYLLQLQAENLLRLQMASRQLQVSLFQAQYLLLFGLL